MAIASDVSLAFVSGGTPGDSMSLLGVEGHESISKLFEMEMGVMSVAVVEAVAVDCAFVWIPNTINVRAEAASL